MRHLGHLFLALCVMSGTALAAPHISMVEARKIALARVPGQIVHEKLKQAKKKKKKKTQTHDHYNIKIAPQGAKRDGLIKKVEIDAETGAILEITDVKPKQYDD